MAELEDHREAEHEAADAGAEDQECGEAQSGGGEPEQGRWDEGVPPERSVRDWVATKTAANGSAAARAIHVQTGQSSARPRVSGIRSSAIVAARSTAPRMSIGAASVAGVA